MPYCTEVEFAKRFGATELAQVKQTNGGLTYESAAADADATIDSYLGAIKDRSFVLPLLVAPARIVGVAADLTRYELWANRASDEIRRRRDEALEYLRDLAAGRAALILAITETAAPLEPRRALGVGYRSNERIFTSDTLAGYGDGPYFDETAGLRGST